ncbi:MAG TPA: TetR/AcrR family transcriptional regulator, partial [Rhodocyclaceae bacterium]|nr:TetR/AcrR family transcriptional regulator [Rhodocyclaceae bacterium]
STGMARLVDLFAAAMSGRSKAVRREKALAAYAAMVGALVLSRATDDAELSEEILTAVRNSLPH